MVRPFMQSWTLPHHQCPRCKAFFNALEQLLDHISSVCPAYSGCYFRHLPPTARRKASLTIIQHRALKVYPSDVAPVSTKGTVTNNIANVLEPSISPSPLPSRPSLLHLDSHAGQTSTNAGPTTDVPGASPLPNLLYADSDDAMEIDDSHQMFPKDLSASLLKLPTDGICISSWIKQQSMPCLKVSISPQPFATADGFDPRGQSGNTSSIDMRAMSSTSSASTETTPGPATPDAMEAPWRPTSQERLLSPAGDYLGSRWDLSLSEHIQIASGWPDLKKSQGPFTSDGHTKTSKAGMGPGHRQALSPVSNTRRAATGPAEDWTSLFMPSATLLHFFDGQSDDDEKTASQHEVVTNLPGQIDFFLATGLLSGPVTLSPTDRSLPRGCSGVRQFLDSLRKPLGHRLPLFHREGLRRGKDIHVLSRKKQEWNTVAKRLMRRGLTLEEWYIVKEGLKTSSGAG